MPDIACYSQNSQWIQNFILPMYISLILCKFPLFSTVGFSLSLDSKLTFLNMGFRVYFKRFHNSRKDSKLGFVNVAVVGLLNIFQFVKEMEYWDF